MSDLFIGLLVGNHEANKCVFYFSEIGPIDVRVSSCNLYVFFVVLRYIL